MVLVLTPPLSPPINIEELSVISKATFGFVVPIPTFPVFFTINKSPTDVLLIANISVSISLSVISSIAPGEVVPMPTLPLLLNTIGTESAAA